MKKKIIAMVIFYFLVTCICGASKIKNHIDDLSESYISEWKQFYPSQALAAGDKKSAFVFENFSDTTIQKWILFNQKCLKELTGQNKLSLTEIINQRILKRQILRELDKWNIDKVLHNDPAMAAGLISQALTHILVRDNLTPNEKMEAIQKRLLGIQKLCDLAKKNVKNGRPSRTRSSVNLLKNTAAFYKNNLIKITGQWIPPKNKSSFKQLYSDTCDQVLSLNSHIKTTIIPKLSQTDIYSLKTYSKKLTLYTDSSLTPDTLKKMALKEIKTVRQLMAEVSEKYWQETYPKEKVPADFDRLLKRSIHDMEGDRENNQKDFLNLFVDLINRAETFVKKNKIATISVKKTLQTRMSPPHFAGAAVGGVYSSGPFDPDADTLFYLPSVPDAALQKSKEGFYRSFNNHFNTMIITHEIFPGHYHHLKISSRHPNKIRSLFLNAIYAEGWATLCEEITLNRGWNNNNTLTRLAHLRKRLENAVRAYVSVKVHCDGWKKETMTDFAVSEGLLAPQFAINLWNRVINSPLQLTSYFIGYKKLSAILKSEQKRLGTAFSLLKFSDRIIREGSVPLDLLPEILKK